MGVGNYSVKNGMTVQIGHEQVYGEWIDDNFEFIEDPSDYQTYYGKLIDNIRELAPKSYESVDCHDRSTSARIIAKNRFYAIQVQDWEGYVAVSIVVKDDDEAYEDGVHPFASYHLNSRAKTFFDKLASCYTLRISACAWTSGAYELSIAA